MKNLSFDGPCNIQAPEWLIVIGTNTGGPQALQKILPQLPFNFPGTVVVVQQMRRGFTRVLTSILSQDCSLPVLEPVDGQALSSSKILITPGGSTLAFEPVLACEENSSYRVLIEDVADSDDLIGQRTDTAMSSIAAAYGQRAIGILLTGLGNDGKEGMRAISEAGGITIAQDEDSSVVHDLPYSAIAADVVQEIVPLWSIADRIVGHVMGDANEIAA